MRVRILDFAEQDLAAGFDFYERQDKGLGEYFLRSLAADIEGLRFHAGVHRQVERFIDAQRSVFLTSSITPWQAIW